MKFTSKDFSKIITLNSITIGYEGKSYTVLKSSSMYEALLHAIKEERWDDVPGLLTPAKTISNFGNGEFVVENNTLYVLDEDGSRIETTDALAKTILFYSENKLPSLPLVRFARKLNKNPSNRSVTQLFNFIEHNKLTINEDGNFIAYKKVNDNFTDCHTGKFDNSVGKVVKMQRNKVEDNPEVTCAAGLHVASYDYAFDFSTGVVVFVEVDPANVVSVPVDYNNAKIRTCEYKVLGVAAGEFKGHVWKDPSSVTDEDEDEDDEDEEDEEDDSDEESCSGCGEADDLNYDGLCLDCEGEDDEAAGY